MATGRTVDARIINAPSSTENASETRNREMQQMIEMSNQRYSPQLSGQRDWAARVFVATPRGGR